jgi:EmrB/QacA subfamily drug resistance transporter
MNMQLTGWRRTVAFVAIIMGFFMALLDATIVNVALPDMTRSFHSGMDHMSWVVNGYNLAFAVCLITASRLADQFGRKRLFMIGVTGFVIASALVGLSDSLPMLVTFRVIQGMAAAIVVPVTIPLAVDLFPPQMRGMIMGIWGGISGLAAASGPTLGGILTDAMGWQAVFYVNLPIGLICLLLSVRLLRESVDPSAGRGIDWLGMGLLTGAMFSLTYALIQANEWGWSSPKLLVLLGAAAVLLVIFLMVESRLRNPMLPLRLFRIGTFNWACLTLLLIGAGVMAPSFLMSYFLTGLLGKSVLQAGLIISAMPLASMVVSASVGALANRFGSRLFVGTGMAVLAASTWLLGDLTAASPLSAIVWRLALFGVGMGLAMAPVMGSVIRNVPEEKIGIASGVTNMTRALGSVMGVALLVMVLNQAVADNTVKAGADIAAWVSADERLPAGAKAELAVQMKEVGGSGEAGEAALRSWVEHYPAGAELAARIGGRMQEASAASFARAFHLGGAVLLAGIVAGLLSDSRKSRIAAEGSASVTAAAGSAEG